MMAWSNSGSKTRATAQRPTGDTVTTEQTPYFVEGAGLLNTPQVFDDRIKEIQQKQAGVLDHRTNADSPRSREAASSCSRLSKGTRSLKY